MTCEADGREPVTTERPSRADRAYFRLRGWIPIPFYVGGLLLLELAPPAPWELAVGCAAVVCGLALRAAARLQLGRSSDTRRLHADRLATEGVYAWTRNPIYLGNWLVAVGVSILAGTGWYAAALGGLLVAHYARVIRAEERLLAESFGRGYREYLARVPRFLPLPPVEFRRSLGRVRRELRIVVGVAIAVAIVLGVRLFGPALAGAL